MANLHEGHRQRMRLRYMMHGPDVFDDHELLEMLLSFSIPRRDTNELAHRLLERFGSLDGLLSASLNELQAVDGVGDSTACLLHLLRSTELRAMTRKLPQRKGKLLLSSPDCTMRYCSVLFRGERNEKMYALCLNAQQALICARVIALGSLSELTVYPRTVLDLAVETHAHSIILAHNHPSGDPLPSEADIATTESVRQALLQIGVELWDHIIVGDGYAFSISAGCVLRQVGKLIDTLTVADYCAGLHEAGRKRMEDYR